MNRFSLSFPGLPANVSFARATVAAFAAQVDQFTLEDLEDIRIAVSEAVSNAVIHAYPQSVGPVEVEVALFPDRLEIKVVDHGRGIPDVEQAKTPTFTTLPGERMGLGLTFVQTYMDEVTISSRPGMGTTVWMVKKLPGTLANGGGGIGTAVGRPAP
ncbi:MAG: anti-sigma F factor [Limnochordales bacterium]|nr:anti-sigma F factor [Limnochordales bacterium]